MVSRIAIVAVAMPARGVQINFDVAAAGLFAGELEDGSAKIRSGFVVPETGMKNAHRLAVQGLQSVAPQALALPDALQQPFGRRGLFRLPQRGRGLSGRSPPIIKTGRYAGHLAIAFRGRRLQSQARFARQMSRAPTQGTAAFPRQWLPRRTNSDAI